MGCCSWNCFSFTAVSNCCYSGEKSKIPFSRMFTSPAKCGACFFAPWYIGLWQALCIVDIIIGPVCVNTADFFITKSNLKPEQCCCITLAGGVEEFDRLHWSLWKWSPLGYFCVPICSDSECGYPVKALDEWAYNWFCWDWNQQRNVSTWRVLLFVLVMLEKKKNTGIERGKLVCQYW